jgi:hypothetical protein
LLAVGGLRRRREQKQGCRNGQNTKQGSEEINLISLVFHAC